VVRSSFRQKMAGFWQTLWSTQIKFALGLLSCVLLTPAISQAAYKDCSAYKLGTKKASLAHLNPSPSQVSGIDFPSHQNTLFRGAYASNPQFDFSKVLQALLGEKQWYVGSPMFWGITEVLTLKRTHDSEFLPTGGLPLTMGEYFSFRNIKDDIDTLLKCRPGKGFKVDEAEFLAADLMDKYLTGLSDREVTDTYLNMSHPKYYDTTATNLGLGNNAVDFVISSTYDQIASLYGQKVLVYKDTHQRAADLTYWNFVNNGFHYHKWVDAGEINSPGYLRADEILGFQRRTQDRLRVGWGRDLTDSRVIFATYKISHNSKDYVVLVDGQQNLCLKQVRNQKIYGCEVNWQNLLTDISPLPKVSDQNDSNLIPIWGVIQVCDDIASCPVDDKFWKFYGKFSSKPVAAEALQDIAKTKVNGKNILFTPAPTVAVAPVKPKAPKVPAPGAQAIPTITVISAVYDAEDVTAKASAFLNGKTSVEYKISTAFLGLAQVSTTGAFVLRWTCSDAPQKPKSKIVPPPIENQKFMVECPRTP
jgi:hypothetical protein